MHPEFSLAHLTALQLSPPELIDCAATCGYAYVGLRLIPVTPVEPPYLLHRDKAFARRTRQRLDATGMRVLDIELFSLFPDVVVRDFEPALDAGAALGARHVIAGARDGEVSRLADHFAELCDLAAAYGLTVNLEPVSFFPIADITRATEVLKRASRPNGGLLLDTLHFDRVRTTTAVLSTLPRRWWNFVQLSDAPSLRPRTREGLTQEARAGRWYLGEGGIDVRAILARLPDIPLSLENPNELAVAAYGVHDHVRRTIAAARNYMNARLPSPARAV